MKKSPDRSRSQGAVTLETESAFVKRWKCDVPLLHEYLKIYVSYLILFEKRRVSDLAKALSDIEQFDGTDRVLFIRMLATACRHQVRVLRDPEWEKAITKGVRSFVKSQVKVMEAKKKEILHSIETLSTLLEGMISNQHRLQESPSPEDVALLDGLEKFRKAVVYKSEHRFLAQRRGYNRLVGYPPEALLVFLLDNVSHRGTISLKLLKAIATFFLTWGFEKTRAFDELAADVGIRLRQRYRVYQHRFVFSLTRKGYDISSI
jgi:hypothetical protein